MNAKPQIDCYKSQDHQIFRKICENCTTLPIMNCSYCLQPNNRSSTEIIPKGQTISTLHDDCVTCTCDEFGVVMCNDLDTSITVPVCYGIDQCEQKLNDLSRNSCQYCEDPVTGLLKRSPSSWAKEIGIYCHCSEGKVSCYHFAIMSAGSGINFAYMIDCGPNCTTDKYKVSFQEKGKFTSIHVKI